MVRPGWSGSEHLIPLQAECIFDVVVLVYYKAVQFDAKTQTHQPIYAFLYLLLRFTKNKLLIPDIRIEATLVNISWFKTIYCFHF